MKKFLIFISIIFILVGTGVIIYMAFDVFQNQIKSGVETQDEDLLALEEQLKNSPPVIYYNDPNKNGITMLLNDGDIFRYQVVIKYTGRKISLVKDGVPIEYKEEKLKDGEYTVVVTGKDETITRHFIVDANAPKVTGIRTGKYNQAQTITFEDVNDVEKATLTNKQTEEVVDIKKYLEDNHTNSYTTPSTPGTYVIEVEDKYGNGIMPITIVIEE